MLFLAVKSVKCKHVPVAVKNNNFCNTIHILLLKLQYVTLLLRGFFLFIHFHSQKNLTFNSRLLGGRPHVWALGSFTMMPPCKNIIAHLRKISLTMSIYVCFAGVSGTLRPRWLQRRRGGPIIRMGMVNQSVNLSLLLLFWVLFVSHCDPVFFAQ